MDQKIPLIFRSTIKQRLHDQRVNAVASAIGVYAKREDELKGKSKFPKPSTPSKIAKTSPKENDSAVKSVQDPTVAVSLHAYLGLPKSQKLTKEDLTKAEKKASKEGNQAILDKIKSVSKFIFRTTSMAPEAKRGYASYNGLVKSPKSAGFPPKECLSVTWGSLTYFYFPTKLAIKGLDKKLKTAFYTNPVAAGVLVNSLVKDKKIQVYMRWDEANKRVHVPATAVTASAMLYHTDASISLNDFDCVLRCEEPTASRAAYLAITAHAKISGVLMTLIDVTGAFAEALIAEGVIDIRNLRVSMYNYGISKGLYKGSPSNGQVAPKPEAGKANEFSSMELAKAYASLDLEDQDVVEAAKKEKLNTGEVSPKKMTKTKSGSSISRVISGEGFSIEIGMIDWKLIENVISMTLPKALVDNLKWIVSRDVNNVRFKSSKPGKTVVVNADLLLLKLKGPK